MEGGTKLHEWSQQPFVHKFPNFSTWDFWKTIGPVGLMTKLCSERSQDLNSGKGECFLSPPRHPYCLWWHTGSRLLCNGLLNQGKSGRRVSLTTHLYRVPGDDAQYKGSVGVTFTVKAAAVGEGSASVRDWQVRWRVGWRRCKLAQNCWWRLVSFGIWCELLTASSVGLPELWRWR
jgi:hypothetical protein